MLGAIRRTARFVLHWFVRFPVIGAIAVAFIAVLAFGGGRAFGLPDLFWHQTAFLKLLLNGFSTAMVFFLVCVVAYLLESEETGESLRRYVAQTYPLLFVFVLIGTIRTSRDPDESSPWWLLIGHLIGVAFAVIATWALILLATQLVAKPAVARTLAKASRASASNQWLHVYATLVIIGFAVVYAILAMWMPDWLPSAVAICLMFCLALLVYGFVRFQFPRERVVVSAALIVVMAIAALVTPYKHRFPALEPLYGHPIAIPPVQSGTTDLLRNDEVLAAWAGMAGPKPKLAIIATSGGGIRSAVWTTAVLNALTTGPYAIPHFPYHIRLMTGASGGMVGAAYYAASIPQPFVVRPMTSISATVQRSLPPMARDSLEPVARSLALRDLPGLFAFWSFHDRGVALESAWSRNAKGVMDAPFSSLAVGEKEGWRPSLVFTPMLVEDGRRLVVSNLDLDFMLQNRYSRPSLDLFRLIPGARKMPIAAAARMNASFPYVAPAAELPTIPRRHVVDAGYWDNFGVHAAVIWIEHNMAWLRANTSGVVVIQIRDEESDNEDLRRPGASVWLRAFDELIAPLVSALRARSSTMVFRNDADLARITDGFIATVVIENPNQSVLSWSLTHRQALDMLDYFDKHPDAVATRRLIALREWWTH